MFRKYLVKTMEHVNKNASSESIKTQYDIAFQQLGA